MRSARILLASAVATAALTVSGPAAYAMALADDTGKDSSSSSGKYSKEDSDSSGYEKESDGEKKSWKHDKPHGGVHTGGGALAGVTGDDWSKDDSEKSDGEKKSWKHDKPHG
ncbi:hypothetical protein ACFU9F_21065, partial [Streptomyces zhihengii]